MTLVWGSSGSGNTPTATPAVNLLAESDWRPKLRRALRTTVLLDDREKGIDSYSPVWYSTVSDNFFKSSP